MDKYLENLVVPDFISKSGGVIELNKDITNKIIEDVNEISLLIIYPKLFVKFYEAGVFERNGIDIDKGIIDRVKYFFHIRKNRFSQLGNSQYIDLKTWVNSLYNNELKQYTPMIFDLYRQYMEKVWTDFIADNPYNWLYIDTDTSFFSGGPKSLDIFKKIGIEYSVTHHEFFYIERPKRYVITDSDNITIKGHRFKPDEVIGIMKSKLRNKKIDSLLND